MGYYRVSQGDKDSADGAISFDDLLTVRFLALIRQRRFLALIRHRRRATIASAVEFANEWNPHVLVRQIVVSWKTPHSSRQDCYVFVAQGSQHAVFVPLGHPTIAHRFNGGSGDERYPRVPWGRQIRHERNSVTYHIHGLHQFPCPSMIRNELCRP